MGISNVKHQKYVIAILFNLQNCTKYLR